MDPQTTFIEDNHYLLEELPDPQEELWIQTLLDDFQYFPKLPKELRLMIWRDAFPDPRTILLPDWQRSPGGRLNFKPIFPPITSRVNQESRSETNLHYLLFWILWDGIPRVDTSCRPSQERLCFAPKRDTFVLDAFVLDQMHQPKYFLAPRLEAYEAIFARVKKLEMVDTFWIEYVKNSRLWDYDRLRLFKDLEKIAVQRPHKPGPDGFGVASDLEFAICMKSVTDFFAREKGRDPNFKIPQVSRRDWDEGLVIHIIQHDMEATRFKWCLLCQRK